MLRCTCDYEDAELNFTAEEVEGDEGEEGTLESNAKTEGNGVLELERD